MANLFLMNISQSLDDFFKKTDSFFEGQGSYLIHVIE